MKRAYLIVAATVMILTGLSWAASVQLGDLDSLPMQWGVGGRPTWHAPKWIALSFGPAIGCFAAASALAARRYDCDGTRAVRNLLPLCAIVIGGHAFYLSMLLTQASIHPV